MISRLKLFGDVSTPKCWWAESSAEDEDEDEDDDGDVVAEVNAELNDKWGGGGGDEPREFITDHALVPLPFLFVIKLFAWLSWDCCWCSDCCCCCCCCLEWVDDEQVDDVEEDEGGELSLDSLELVRLVGNILLLDVVEAVFQLFAYVFAFDWAVWLVELAVTVVELYISNGCTICPKLLRNGSMWFFSFLRHLARRFLNQTLK